LFGFGVGRGCFHIFQVGTHPLKEWCSTFVCTATH